MSECALFSLRGISSVVALGAWFPATTRRSATWVVHLGFDLCPRRINLHQKKIIILEDCCKHPFIFYARSDEFALFRITPSLGVLDVTIPITLAVRLWCRND